MQLKISAALHNLHASVTHFSATMQHIRILVQIIFHFSVTPLYTSANKNTWCINNTKIVI